MSAPIWAHASALMQLRAKSLQAYGIDPHSLIVPWEHPLMVVPTEYTRALAVSKREERALAIQEDHRLVIYEG